MRRKPSSNDFQMMINGGDLSDGGNSSGKASDSESTRPAKPIPASPAPQRVTKTAHSDTANNNNNNGNNGNNNNNNGAHNLLSSMVGNSSGAQLGIAMGSTLLGNANQMLQDPSSGLNRYVNMHGIKYYFNVDNQYVLNKLRLILFPFRNTTWKRKAAEASADAPRWLAPRHDLNAPDLYIPTMAFVTYVLLISVVLGQSGTFHPALLGSTFTAGLIAMGLEIALYKAVFFVLQVHAPIPLLDLLAYSAYKYVGIVVNISLGLLLGSIVYYVSLLATTLSVGLFLSKTLQAIIVDGPNQRTRSYLLFGIMLLQFPLAWFMGVSASLL